MDSTVRSPTFSSRTVASWAECGSGAYSTIVVGSSWSLAAGAPALPVPGSTGIIGGSSRAGSSHQSTPGRSASPRSEARRPDSAEAAKASGSVTMAEGSSAAIGSSTDWVIESVASVGRHTTKVRSVASGSSSPVTVSSSRRVPQ